MKNSLFLLGTLFLIVACGVEVAKAPDSPRGPSVTGPVAAQAPQSQAQPTVPLREKAAESPVKKTASSTETVVSPLAPIECPEGTQYYFQDVTEGCLVELADGRVVPTHRWKQYYGSRDGLMNNYREYKDGYAQGTWKAWTAKGMPKVAAQFQEGRLVKMQRHGEDVVTVVSEIEALPEGTLTKLKLSNGLIYTRTGDKATYLHRSNEYGTVMAAELKDGKFVFSQGSASRVLLMGFDRYDLGRFAHANNLTSFLRATQSFSYLPVAHPQLQMTWQPPAGPDKALSNYLDVGDMIRKTYTLPKNDQNEELFDFQAAGITENFRKDPGTAVVFNVLDYYRKTDETFLRSKFPALPFQ